MFSWRTPFLTAPSFTPVTGSVQSVGGGISVTAEFLYNIYLNAAEYRAPSNPQLSVASLLIESERLTLPLVKLGNVVSWTGDLAVTASATAPVSLVSLVDAPVA